MLNDVLTKLQYGLYILSSRADEKDNACIINTVMQVSNNPEKIAIAINNDSYTGELIKKSGVFNVSVLTEQTPFYVFEHFGFSSGRNGNKFEKTDNVFRSENGVFVVPKFANAYLSANVTNTIDLGSHTMLVGQVTAGYAFSNVPSLTYGYYYNNIRPKPQQTDKKGFRCKVCGYIYEGDELPPDYICPICKHGAADFERI